MLGLGSAVLVMAGGAAVVETGRVPGQMPGSGPSHAFVVAKPPIIDGVLEYHPDCP